MLEQRNAKKSTRTKQREDVIKSNYKITDFMREGRKSVEVRARSESPDRTKIPIELPKTKVKSDNNDDVTSVSASVNEIQSEFDIANKLIEISTVVAKQIQDEN